MKRRSNPGRKLLAIVLLWGLLLLTGAQVVGGQSSGDYLLYIPVAIKPPLVMTSIPPAGSWYLNAEGESLGDTLAGGADQLWRYDPAAAVWNLPPGPGRPLYHVNRAFLSFDLADIPAGTIISATLELCIWDGSLRGDFQVGFYQGNWIAPPEMADWDSIGSQLGALDTNEMSTGPDHTRVPLAGLVGQAVPEQLSLVIRGDETTELVWGDELSARFTLWEGEPVSRLWLAVRE